MFVRATLQASSSAFWWAAAFAFAAPFPAPFLGLGRPLGFALFPPASLLVCLLEVASALQVLITSNSYKYWSAVVIHLWLAVGANGLGCAPAASGRPVKTVCGGSSTNANSSPTSSFPSSMAASSRHTKRRLRASFAAGVLSSCRKFRGHSPQLESWSLHFRRLGRGTSSWTCSAGLSEKRLLCGPPTRSEVVLAPWIPCWKLRLKRKPYLEGDPQSCWRSDSPRQSGPGSAQELPSPSRTGRPSNPRRSLQLPGAQSWLEGPLEMLNFKAEALS